MGCCGGGGGEEVGVVTTLIPTSAPDAACAHSPLPSLHPCTFHTPVSRSTPEIISRETNEPGKKTLPATAEPFVPQDIMVIMIKSPRGRRGGKRRSRGKKSVKNLEHGLASGLVSHAEKTSEKVDLRCESTDCEQTGVSDCKEVTV